MDKKTGILIAVIGVLLVSVALLIGIIIGQKKGGSEEGTTAELTEEVKESSEQKAEETHASESDTEAKAADDNDGKTPAELKKDKYACYVVLKKGDSWPADGGYVTQFDGNIYNKSDEDLSDWKIDFTGFSGGTFVAGWNGKYKISGDTLTVTPESYNADVPAKNSVNFGMQIKFKDEDKAKAAGNDYILYFGGEEYTKEKKDEPKQELTEAEKKAPEKAEKGTPLENHGKLSVSGTDLVDKNGDKYQLKGVSTHGLSWFPQYVNEDAFRTVRDDWGGNLIRLAMYTHESGGYCTDGNKEELKKLIDDGVSYATGLGMYVIIDWHILQEQDPTVYEDEAAEFWNEMSSKYADYDNVLYEICNEPNGGTDWATVKAYAEKIIPIIRKNDKDAVIIVGTPTWSQDVDAAAADPIKGYDNIMYTLHFYAATHKDNIRDKLKKAHSSGLPVFISEFSICEASGNGYVDTDSADDWMKLINEYDLSYAGWALANKDEAACLIEPDCDKVSGWSDDELSETGLWLKNTIKSGR